MGKALFWRRTHRVLALIVGVQALLWMASGLYMTAISIDVIHGDHLAHTHRPALAAVGPLKAPAAVGIAPDEALRLKQWQGRPVYEVGKGPKARLIDARTGAVLSPLTRATAQSIAQALYHRRQTSLDTGHDSRLRRCAYVDPCARHWTGGGITAPSSGCAA